MAPSGCSPATNPFRVRRIQPGALAYQFSGATRPAENLVLLARLADQIADSGPSCNLIVGPHGTGKSTLLKALRPLFVDRFDQVCDWRLTADRSSRGVTRTLGLIQRTATRLPNSRSNHRGLLIIDGLEQLNFPLRLVLKQLQALLGWTVLGTSHQPMRGWRTVHRTRACPKIIRRLAEQLIQDQPENLADQLRFFIDQQDLQEIEDVREFWFAMYDEAAGSPSLPVDESCSWPPDSPS